METAEVLDRLDVNEKHHLDRLLARKEYFDIPITDDYNLALAWIALTLKNWPKGFTPKYTELLAIMAGEEQDLDLTELWGQTWNWFPAFLPSLNAWRDVSRSILEIEQIKELGPQGLSLGICPPTADLMDKFRAEDKVFESWFHELNQLMAGVLRDYAPADKEIFWGEKKHDATRELLKGYRRYVCCVCLMAQEVWPKVNLKRLLEHA